MSDPTDKQTPEQQLDEYLQGDSSVSRQYRQLHNAEVPAELDRLVLRQAHDAVKVAPAKSRTRMRWVGPLALAASAVLVVSIVIESGTQHEVLISSEKAAAPAASSAVETKLRSDAVESDAAGSVAKQAPVAPQPAAPSESAQDQSIAASSESAREQRSEPADEVAQDRAVHAYSAPPPPAAPIAEERAPAAERLEAPPPLLARERREVTTQSAALPESVTPVPADVEQELNGALAGAATDSRLQTISAHSDPERWLQRIRQLRKDHQDQLADREWRRFREAFPDHPVSKTDTARAAEN